MISAAVIADNTKAGPSVDDHIQVIEKLLASHTFADVAKGYQGLWHGGVWWQRRRVRNTQLGACRPASGIALKRGYSAPKLWLNENDVRKLNAFYRCVARLLIPREEVISKALRACVKYSANFVPEASSDGSDVDLSADGTGAIPTDAINTVPVNTQSEEIRIATAVAHAVTVTETEVDENLDLSTIHADTTGLVPAEIKRGDKTIKGLAPGSTVKGYRIEKSSVSAEWAKSTAPYSRA